MKLQIFFNIILNCPQVIGNIHEVFVFLKFNSFIPFSIIIALESLMMTFLISFQSTFVRNTIQKILLCVRISENVLHIQFDHNHYKPQITYSSKFYRSIYLSVSLSLQLHCQKYSCKITGRSQQQRFQSCQVIKNTSPLFVKRIKNDLMRIKTP